MGTEPYYTFSHFVSYTWGSIIGWTSCTHCFARATGVKNDDIQREGITVGAERTVAKGSDSTLQTYRFMLRNIAPKECRIYYS